MLTIPENVNVELSLEVYRNLDPEIYRKITIFLSDGQKNFPVEMSLDSVIQLLEFEAINRSMQ